MAKIIHARLNENGQIMYGLPGDQTKNEVVKQDFYDSDWHTVYRAKEAAIAKYMVKGAEQIAANDHFGYGQDDRYTGFDESKKVNFQFDKVTKNCDFDCSSMIMTLITSAGIAVPKAFYTWNMDPYMVQTGYFDKIAYQKGMELKEGDILLKTGHVVLVVEGSEETYASWVGEAYGLAFIPVYKKPDASSERCGWPTLGVGNLFEVIGEDGEWFFIRIANEYYGYIRKIYVLRKTPAAKGEVTSDVYVRVNAGSNFAKMKDEKGREMVLKKGQVVDICDAKKASTGRDWYYLLLGDRYGFSSSMYIKKR